MMCLPVPERRIFLQTGKKTTKSDIMIPSLYETLKSNMPYKAISPDVVDIVALCVCVCARARTCIPIKAEFISRNATKTCRYRGCFYDYLYKESLITVMDQAQLLPKPTGPSLRSDDCPKMFMTYLLRFNGLQMYQLSATYD